MVDFLTEDQITGGATASAGKPATGASSQFLSEEQITGQVPSAPAPTFMEKMKTAYGKVSDTLAPVQADTLKGMAQAGTEVRAIANMAASVPGGVAGSFMNAMSRVSDLLRGTPAAEAGAKARSVEAQVNTDWGKLTTLMGVPATGPGSGVEAVIGKFMDKAEQGGSAIEKATKGWITADTVATLRDEFMNLAGAHAMLKVPKGGPATTAEALKPKIEGEPAVPPPVVDAAAATITPETAPEAVQNVVDHALANRTPLEEAWKGKQAAPKAPDVWQRTVDSLIEPPPEGVRPMGEVAPTPEGPGITPKTRLTEGVVIGEVPDLIDSALAKLQKGELISADEAKAVRRLTPRPGEGTIVDPTGRSIYERGAVDPDLLKVLGLMGLGAVASTALYNWYSSSGLSEDNTRDIGLGLGLLGAAGIMKGVSEAKLIDTFKEGGKAGEAAAAGIYENTHRQLTKAVQGWGKDLPVEDIVQQTYEKAFSALKKGQFRGDSELSTWLYGIAKNEMYDIYGSKAAKAARREVQPSVDPETGAQVLPEKAMMEQNPEAYRSTQDVASENQMMVKMQSALDKLPDNYRKIFDAVELQGLSYEEAAAQLKVPVGTVRSGLSRAKEQLQGSLREYRDLQSGKMDPATMAKLGLVAGGAALGASWNDKNPVGGALMGTAGGFGLAALFHLSPGKAVDAMADAIKPDTRIRVDQFDDAHDAGMATANRAIWQQQRGLVKEAPEAADRAAITTAIQLNKVGSLSQGLQIAANRAKTFFAEMGEKAQKMGLIKDLIDDYVTNLWDLTGKNKDIWEGILNKAGGPSMSPETRFALKRSITNLEVGKKLGLIPLTEDIAQIMGIYGQSLARSMENAKMIKSLKGYLDPGTGLNVLMSSEKAPHSYVTIDSPQLNGMRVHPDIAPSLAFIFDRANSGVIAQGFQALNTAIKRSAVMGSLFHAKALLDGFTGAIEMNKKMIAGGAAAGALYGVASGGSPVADALFGAGAAMMLPGLKLVGQAALPRTFGENIYLKQLAEGKAGDMVGTLLNAGLKISFEKGPLAVEDVGGTFYRGMTMLQQGLDKVIPGAGLPVKAMVALNHAIDGFMWERLHAAMKLTVAAQKLEQMIQNNAKAHVKDPRVALQSMDELAAHAASFTNDIFGGLDWRRIAEGTQSKLGRDIALQVYSPAGRRVAQAMMFAPDWTVSTTRAATQAFSGAVETVLHPSTFSPTKLIQSFLAPENAVGLHRQYMVRSALYYATIANGINYAMSGHFVWDNKDPTTIDLGDGRTMQWSKHMMEPIHWVTKPLQQAANKLGYFPKEAINQLTGKEYVSVAGNAPPMDTSALGRLAHVGKSMMPISAQGAFGGKASSGGAISSTLGVPIYGKIYEERAAAKEALKQLHQTPEYKQLQADRKAARK